MNIPEEWKVETVQDASSRAPNSIVGGPFGSDLISSDYVDIGIPVIRGQNMSGVFVAGDFAYVTNKKAVALSANTARKGDLIFTQRGTLGQVAIVPDLPYEKYLISQSQMKVTLDRGRHDPAYVRHYFTSSEGQRKIELSAIQTGVPHTNLGILKRYKFPAPMLNEQLIISGALDDVDALLAGLDKLIAKKRDIKQATMQQLLTGKTRLPGFAGAWEVMRLGDLAEITMGRTPSRSISDNWGAGHVWLSIADMKGKFVLESKEEITELAASGMTMVPAGTLMMSFKLSIGRLAFAGRPLYTNEAICAFRQPKCNVEYLYYALSRVDFSLYGKQAVKGYTLNSESLRCVEVLVPNEKEQAGISSMLSDMDAELHQLEAQREKTRLLKQGMMQELLTGRTRLV